MSKFKWDRQKRRQQKGADERQSRGNEQIIAELLATPAAEVRLSKRDYALLKRLAEKEGKNNA